MAEKKVFAAIEATEAQIEATHLRRQQKQEQLIVDYLREREPLLQRRYELVTGRSEPNNEELQGFQPQGAAAAAATPTSPGAGGGGKGGKAAAKAAGPSRGVPYFWLNALCNQDELAALITPRDRHALEYLEDVRYVRGPAGMAIEFHFSPANPYFTNTVLRKGIFVKRAGGAAAAGAGAGGDIQEAREEATVIDWRPGRCLLVRGAAGAGAEGGGRGKQAGGGGGGGGKKKGGKGKGGGAAGGGGGGKKVSAASAAAPSRARRHHGKHGGPAPDLPDPAEEEEEQQEEEVEGDGEEQVGEEEHDAAGGGGRRKPCPSFFRFFLPISGGGSAKKGRELDPTAEGEDTDEEDEEEEEDAEAARARRARDGEVLDVLIRKVVPRATHLYLAGSGGGKASRAAADAEEEEGFTLVSGSPAGDVAALALSAQRALHALVGLQRRLDELAAGLKASEWGCVVAQAEEVARLAAQRRSLLVGPAGASTGKLSIPAFWLRALRATPVGGSAVGRRDEGALACLADVRLVWDNSKMPSPEEPTRCATLEFEFLPNRWFSNSVLRKRFTFHAPGGSFNKLGVQSAQADPIDWHPGADLTVTYPRGQRPKAGGGGGGGGGEGDAGSGGGGPRPRARQVPSFFHYFSNTPGSLCRAFNIPGQSRAAQAEAAQVHEELMAELINMTLNFAGRLAAESKVDVSDLGDEREDDEEEEEEGEGSEEEEDEAEEGEEESEEAAARRAARRAAAAANRAAGRKRGGAAGAAAAAGGGAASGGGVMGLVRRLSSSPLLLTLVIAMGLAQVLLFLETLEYVRGKYSWAP